MKKLLSIVAVAGMTAIVACGPSAAEKAAKVAADSTRIADSTAKVNMAMKAKADSAKAADDKKAAMDKAKADSIAMAAHADSVAKKLIKEPKKDDGKKKK
jgi:hypothetical protein